MSANLQEIVISPHDITMSSTGQSHYGWQDSTMADTSEEIHYGSLDSMMPATNEEINVSNLPKFPKVPSTIRQIKQNEECYDPSLVSIGPYHHGKDELKEMEKLKVTFARQFVKDSVNDDVNQERYKEKYQEMYRRVEQVASRVRKYYIEDASSQLKNEEFAQMMFFDGCFILQFLFCLLKRPEKLKMSSHDVVLVARDLFLLENQLPFEVLNELTRLRFGGENIELFEAFFKHIRSMPTQRESCREKTKKILLTVSDFFRRILTSTNPKGQESEMTPPREPAHLLEHFHFTFVGRKVVPDASTRKSWYRDDSRKTWSGRYFPAKDLRNVGIHFKPSETSLFTDVEFRRTLLAGRLYIPPLSIDDSTKPLLLNLVAYEAFLGAPNDWVTSYVCFMDSLIDNPEDVNELRTKGVLFSTLGNDKQVAELFNQISDYLVPNPYAYVEVKSAIESHYRNGFKRWILHYKGPIYSFVLKYSFIYGLIVSAIKAYVVIVPTSPDLGICKMPATNVTLNP